MQSLPYLDLVAARAPQYRWEAVVDPGVVNGWAAEVEKAYLPILEPDGRSAHGVEYVTTLSLVAWVRNLDYHKNVYVDVHVLGSPADVIDRKTLALRYRDCLGGGGDAFVLDQPVYRGSGEVSWHRTWRYPDARGLLYRLYAEIGGRPYSDGVLYGADIPGDAVVQRGPAVADAPMTSYLELVASRTPCYRLGAVADPSVVNVLSANVMKRDGVPYVTPLSLVAWVRNLDYVKQVYIDVHVVGAPCELIHTTTLALRYRGSEGGGGDAFMLDQPVRLGWADGQFESWTRPKARAVLFRLYAEVGGRLYTDGILHGVDVPEDFVAGSDPQWGGLGRSWPGSLRPLLVG